MEIVGDTRARVGESPFWSAREQSLLWSDLRGQAIHQFNVATGKRNKIEFDQPVAAPLPLTTGGFAALLADGLWRLGPDGWAFHSGPSQHNARHRFNDATIDPAGRLIAGTMVERGLDPAPSGALYRLGHDGWRRLLDGFWTINGLAFSLDGRTIYFSDSHPSVSTVWCADYDPEVGHVGPRRVFVQLDPVDGRPDGAAVDSEGAYWIAAIGGGRLLRYAPDGRLDRALATPTRFPTKPAFGGADLKTLFVTSLRPEDCAAPVDGALFQFEMDVAGAPIPTVDVGGP